MFAKQTNKKNPKTYFSKFPTMGQIKKTSYLIVLIWQSVDWMFQMERWCCKILIQTKQSPTK